MDDVYIACYERLLVYAQKLCTGTSLDAEDLVQSSFVRARKYWPNRKHDDNIPAWLHRVMYSEFCDLVRKEKRRAAMHLGEHVSWLAYEDNDIYGLVLREEAKVILDQMPIKYAKAVWLKAHGWSTKEIAEILDVNEGTASSRIQRGREYGREIQERMSNGGSRSPKAPA